MAAGRKTKYCNEYCQQIIEMLSAGKTVEEFAYSIGVSIQTISRWRKKHPKFSESIEVARTACKRYWLIKAREAALDKKKADELDYRYFQIFVRNVVGLAVSDSEARLQVEVDELRQELDDFMARTT